MNKLENGALTNYFLRLLLTNFILKMYIRFNTI